MSKKNEPAAFVKVGKKTCDFDAPMANIKAWKADIAAQAKTGGLINSKYYDLRKKDLE